jgi:phage gp45-like
VDFNRFANAVRMMLTRAKVAGAVISGRTLMQVTRYDTEVFNSVELLLPPGYVANPSIDSDVLVIQVGSLADHKVALGGDNTADAVADLQPGEGGMSRQQGQRQLIQRLGWTEIIDPAEVRIIAPAMLWSPDGGKTFLRLATEQHTHGGVQTGDFQTETPSEGLT